MPPGAPTAKRVTKWAGWLALALAWPLAIWAPAAPRPKLTVLIVAEQFRPDYLDRYRPSFSAGGFNRLLKGGAVFRQCRYDYMATFPASGAAVLATGAYPDRTGIVAEHWYDRSSRRVVSAVEDADYAVVGVDAPRLPGASPRKLLGSTLADQLRLGTGGQSRVLSISLRDQTAVLLGGRKPVGCYWLDETGRFVTSSYYRQSLPVWVAAFVKEHPALGLRPWKAIDAKDNAPPMRVIGAKDGLPAADVVAGYVASPFALEDEFDLARAAVTEEQLGERASSDLLVLSLSSFYLLGLEVGADSPLMRDLVLRLDRKLAEFMAWLESRMGADNVWTIFTATQGLQESEDTLKAEGIRGGRVSGEQVATAVNAKLSAAFGRDRYVAKYVFPSLYLRRPILDRLPEAARLAGEAALGVPGVAGYLVPNGASSFQGPESVRVLARSWAPERAGDVLIAYQPYYSELYGDGRGISTGSFYSYDTRVPLLLYGSAFRAQTFEAVACPADLAPTLAAALEIAPPSSASGRVLVEALKER